MQFDLNVVAEGGETRITAADLRTPHEDISVQPVTAQSETRNVCVPAISDAF